MVDEKARTATLTARGIKKAEELFQVDNLADPENTTLSHHINQAIKARGVMQRDIDYVVKDGEVIIVDEFTGRLMFGRRYNEGLHQAIEAKEGVQVANESKTLATITFQNYFRLYDKLSGMTGTAMTEQEEFGTIYELDIVEIPTNKPVSAYRPSRRGVQERPPESSGLSSTRSRSATRRASPCWWAPCPSRSPRSSLPCSAAGHHPHNVLNAKNHEKEAEIVAQAGKMGPSPWPPTWQAVVPISCWAATPSIWPRLADLRKAGLVRRRSSLRPPATPRPRTRTSSTPGRCSTEPRPSTRTRSRPRPTRCALQGGLFILGTERHESRRIDNQLRGRAGRQGDPGETRFYLCLEDDIMRLFGCERVMGMMEKLGVDEDTPIDAEDPVQRHGERPEERGVPQLPDPQERAEVRRRDEHPA